ncbi:MAG: FtsX-like permease family protein [Victivallales bacterium]|nr:FtsX-like permease family protein [Victivallales bacterium]
MTVLNKKLKRDLFLSKGMLAAIITLIAIGTGFLVGMDGTYNNLHNAKMAYYSRCRMPDFWINLKKAPVVDVKNHLNKVKGISEIRNRIVYPAMVDLEGVNKPITATAVSLPGKDNSVINNLYIKTGSYFSPGNKKQVIVSYKFAKARNIRPGSYISLIIKGRKKKLYVIGTAISSEYVFTIPPGSMCPDSENYGIFWVKDKFAQNTLGYDGACNNIVGLFNPNGKVNPKLTLDTFAKTLDQYGVFTSTLLKNQQSNLSLNSELSGIQMMATMLPIIFLSVAALVLNVIMTRLAEQERVIIGTLKALGVKNNAIFSFYLKYSLFVGISGGVLGCLVGYWLSQQMTQMYTGIFTFPHLINHIYLKPMLAGIIISVFFAVIGTVKGVKLMISLNPAEAMHPPPPASGKPILLERFKTLWKHFSFRTQIVMRGIFRNKIKSIIGITAAALGSSLVLMSLGMMNSIDYMVMFQFKNVLHNNYSLHFKTPLGYSALYEAQRLPGVTYAEPQLKLSVNFKNGRFTKKCQLTGILPNSKLVTPCDSKGRRIRIPQNGIAMTKRLAKKLHVKQGEYITFSTIKGDRTPHKVKIASTVKSTLGIPVYINYKYFNRLLGEDHIITNILLKTDQTSVQKKEFLKKLKKFPMLTSYNNKEITQDSMDKELNGAYSSMVYTMIFFAGIIFFGSILNSVLISIAERKREIATFRVLGYKPLEVGSLFLREILAVNIIGSLLGLPLGYLLLFGMCFSFTNDMYAMPCYISLSSYVLTLILSLFFMIGSYLIIQRTINKLDWPQALNAKQ